MAQSQTGVQIGKAVQTATLTPQQVLLVKLLELTTVEMEERARNEIADNPALERGNDEYESDEFPENAMGNDEPTQDGGDGDYNPVDDYREDDIPEYKLRENNYSKDAQAEEIPVSDTVSFYDELKEQLSERELTEQQQELAEYLIGSLDEDGLLRTPLDSIVDELGFNIGINTTREELEKVLLIIQDFDPAGLGARTLQECLLLQIRRKLKKTSSDKNKDILLLCERVLTDYCDDFLKKNWDKIVKNLDLKEHVFKDVCQEIFKLNPKPGAALGEVVGRNTQQIIPDFIVEVDDDGYITLTLNSRNVPELRMNRDFKEMLEEHTKNAKNQSKESREAMLFLKQKMDAAQGFIDAVKQRQNTLIKTMQAIIDLQRPFFLEGDEALLRPMILQDVADKTGLDISTISRVNNSKYVQTNYGIFPLKFFFSDSYVAKDGQEFSVRTIRKALRKCIEEEDKHKPLTDEGLAAALEKKGFPIARRTVTKYREMEHIPVAKLRKVL